MKILKSIIALCLFVALVGIYGCDSMTDNFKQYTEENNYSGKVSNLRVYAGYERVALAWDNPKDQKSKSIKIVYGADSLVKTYETLVDSVSIDGLNAGTGYEFTVFTADAHGNLSVPTSITAFPISEAFVNSLTAPAVIVQTVGADHCVSFVGLTNVVMSFAGELEFTVKAPDGSFEGSYSISDPDLAGKNQIDVPVTEIGGPTYWPVGQYEFEYSLSVKPIMSNMVSIDAVDLDNKAMVAVGPVKINLMTVAGGQVSDQYNTTGGEGIQMGVDSNSGTKYLTGHPTTWMMWKMPIGLIGNMYTLTSANDHHERDPRNWIIEGSNDGVNWVELDRRENESFPAYHYTKTYELPNQTESYTHYRFNVLRNNEDNDNTGIFQIADWIMYYNSAL